MNAAGPSRAVRLGTLLLAALLLAMPGSARAVTLGILTGDGGEETAVRAVGAARLSAEEKGWQVLERDGGGDPARAATALGELLDQRAQALLLVMAPVGELARGLARAREQGATAVSILSGPSPDIAYDATINAYAAGAQIGAWLLDQMPPDASLLVLRDERDRFQARLAKVLDLMLQDRLDLKVGRLQAVPGAALETGLRAGLAGRPDAIWAGSDALALQAETIAAAAGRPPRLITGIGGDQALFTRMRSEGSPIAATVAIPYELLGEAAIDAVEDLVGGTPQAMIAPARALYVDPILVDRKTVPQPDDWPW